MFKIKFPEFIRLVSLWLRLQFWIIALYVGSPQHQSHALDRIPNIGNQNDVPKKSKEDPKYGRIDEYFIETPKASLMDGDCKINNQMDFQEKIQSVLIHKNSLVNWVEQAWLWCCANPTFRTKIQNWRRGHKLTSLRSLWNLFWAFSCTEFRVMAPPNLTLVV